MQTRSFDSVDAFLAVAGGFLAAREANHCLSLGICSTIPRDKPLEGDLAAALVDDRVVATTVWTPGREVVLSEVDDPAALPPLAGRLPPGIRAVHAPVEHAEAFATLVAARHGRRPVQPAHGARQGVYELRSVLPPRGVPGSFRPAEPGDRELLIEWVIAFAVEATGHRRAPDSRARAGAMLDQPERTVSLWVDREPVSMCATFGATPHGIRLSGVYTPPGLRRRGYASALVAAASQAELDRGRTSCFLFTDLANPTSNRIYQAVGYRFVREVAWYDLVDA